MDQFDLRQKELNASSTTISEMQRVITKLQSVNKTCLRTYCLKADLNCDCLYPFIIIIVGLVNTR